MSVHSCVPCRGMADSRQVNVPDGSPDRIDISLIENKENYSILFS